MTSQFDTTQSREPPTDPKDLWKIIEWGAKTAPRSMQTRIGPSGVGDPCFRCLAAKLVGEPGSGEWTPAIGTAVHAWLEKVFARDNQVADDKKTPGRWLLEQTVTVGEVEGVGPITGSADVYDLWTDTVIDWKVVGPSTLTRAKNGPTEIYRNQLHLYGAGFYNLGYHPAHVAICYLPRAGGVPAKKAVWWTEPWDKSVAHAALARAGHVMKAVEAMGLEHILDTVPPTKGCFGCAKRPVRSLQQAFLTR